MLPGKISWIPAFAGMTVDCQRDIIAMFSYPYCAVAPPSITSSAPVTNDDSSDARYSTP